MAFLLVLIQVAVAHAYTKRLPSSTRASYSQVMTFKKGSSEISKEDKAALEALMRSVKDRSQKIDQAHVAVWADNLNRDQASRDLAESRIVTIETELEGPHQLSNVECYNMTERSNWFARAWDSSARDIKAMFANKGAPQNVTPEDFMVVKAKGGLMKAVVLIELEPASPLK